MGTSSPKPTLGSYSNRSPSLEIFQNPAGPRQTRRTSEVSLARSRREHEFASDCHLYKYPHSHLYLLNPQLNSGIPSQKRYRHSGQDPRLYGSVSSQHRYLFSCKCSQRNSEQSIRMEIITSDKCASGPVCVFKMSFDKPSIYISEGRETEIGNCTCMKTKAVSDKSFC